MTKIILPIIVALMATSCDGILDGIYDDAPADDTFAEGFHEGGLPNHRVLMLNATSYDEWIYIDLHGMGIERRRIPDELTSGDWDGKSGITYQLVHGSTFDELSVTKTDAQADARKWDFAIHHFDVKTNGGSAAVAPTKNLFDISASDASSLTFTPDKWSDNQVIVDLKEMMGFKIGYQNSMFNPVLSAWATMDFSTPPPVYSASGDAYVLKLADGTLAAMQLRSYISPMGTKGFLTIDIVYPL